MGKIIVTQHAYDRMKERCGFNKKAADRMSKMAYEKGINHSEVKGDLFSYISKQCLARKIKGKKIKIYGEMVYCFVDTKIENNEIETKLITVFEIPQNLKKKALCKQAKKNKKKSA